MTRRNKTHAERAQEAVDVLERRHARLAKQRDKLEAQIDALGAESRDVKRRLAYARQNPDLPSTPSDSIAVSDTKPATTTRTPAKEKK